MTDRKIRELELLAPARNTDIGIAAIDCGADAVYIAGPQFGARQAAGNSMEEIRRLCSYAHRFGARIFITLNTILYDSELEEARSLMLEAQDAGADALIVQDLSILKMAAESRSQGKRFSLPLHASTQCAIRTPDQARFYEDLGFSRLVLERELSLEQIRAIREAVRCELEFFVHGALCVCYSGQCYMSEAITGRSANRGACAQACRSLYDLEDGNGKLLLKNKAILSLKDFNLRDRLSDLIQAGITSFKIEGRLKNMSYVKNIVREYSLELDRIAAASEGTLYRASYGQVQGGFTPCPDKTFNRGYTGLFLDGTRGKWSTFDSAKGMGEEIGTVSFVSPGKDMLRIRPSAGRTGGTGLKLNNGDGFSFVTRESEVVGFRAETCNGLEIRCRPVPEIFQGARLFRNTDTAFEKRIETGTPERSVKVYLDVCITRTEGRFSICVKAESEDGRTVTGIYDAGILTAENRERMESLFCGPGAKNTGHYRFVVKNLQYDTDGQLPLMAVSSINGIRRTTAEMLDSMPCIPRPLMNRTAEIDTVHPSASFPDAVTYKANVANNAARQIYAACGAGHIEPAYEISHRDGIELMRTKYCIRHELGLCHGSGKAAGKAGYMFLLNNGRRFILHFDCARCEMTVLQGTPGSRK